MGSVVEKAQAQMSNTTTRRIEPFSDPWMRTIREQVMMEISYKFTANRANEALLNPSSPGWNEGTSRLLNDLRTRKQA